MSLRFAHISDIHWRGLKRHDEYRNIFSKIFLSLKEEKPDIIFIGGDIVHSKTQGISPELIDNLNWWFNSLAAIAPTHIILGNHDGLILNKDRQDAITPIINALNNDNIKLYKDSGTYPILQTINGKMVNWCVFSCFDEENWDKVRPVEGEINIACFHGAVWGSKTDIDWELEGEVNLSFFEDFDFTFLGDIHKLQYLDSEERVAYPGSTIQQNYGEDIKKGYLLWDINGKHDYKSKFISIDNPFPFVTIDWKGSVEKTIPFISKIKKGARFRIRSDKDITQVEIQLLHHYLKEEKFAKEIVYQNTGKSEANITHVDASKAKTFNVRSANCRKEMLKDFFLEVVPEDQVDKVNHLFKMYLNQIPDNCAESTNNKWIINSLRFDNTFSYGKDNLINFDNLPGVVGLFGNNRAGKSSIPGSLMYCLFNSSDRGSIKNQNIVNTRKGHCLAVATITSGQDKYLVERKTVKKSSKSGKISATTNLTLKSLSNNSLQDETEEQRRETEKVLRGIIGSSEDFLYTSFASQGEMNTFIKEKSSARKSVLSKFLSLDLYEELYKKSREEYIVLKNRQKNIEEKSWKELTSQKADEINILDEECKNVKLSLSLLREEEVNVKVEINNIEKNNKKHPSGYTLEKVISEVDYLKNKIKNNKINKQTTKEKIDDDFKVIEKINLFKESYSLQRLERDKDKLDILKSKIQNAKRNKVFLNEDLKRNKNSLKILEEVPCDEKYSSCKFIKDAYSSKDNIRKVSIEIKDIEAEVLEISSAISNIEKNNIEEKIRKYNEVLNKEYRAKLSIESNKEKLESIEEKLYITNEKLKSLEIVHDEIRNLTDDRLNEKLKALNLRLKQISSEIYDNDDLIVRRNKAKFYLEEEIKSLEIEKESYYKLIDEWKTFDLFSHAVSKKGIPTMLINNSLPLINNEINKILSGVVAFNINLEDDGTNLNVYIDYGDSKRVIECASGMEKMITSIAIRVALVNISALPKSNVLIIDEGFGALDDSNIEACTRLLKSLKKYFKTILIISHVDSIKDIVDKNLVIERKGADSHVVYR
jgi:DNA repair exonuclease SbcCD ATPase subunit